MWRIILWMSINVWSVCTAQFRLVYINEIVKLSKDDRVFNMQDYPWEVVSID